MVDAACFNLEVWSEDLFSRICPGKHAFVGYSRWIESLENAVGIFGKGRVYTAMVAGIELEPEYGMSWEQASELAIAGRRRSAARVLFPSTHSTGRWEAKVTRITCFGCGLFEELNIAYYNIRQRYGLEVWEGFMCHKCAYMQLECDMDRSLSGAGAQR